MDTETMLLMQENFDKMAKKLDSIRGGGDLKDFKTIAISKNAYSEDLVTIRGKGYVKQLVLNNIENYKSYKIIVDGGEDIKIERVSCTNFDEGVGGYILGDFKFNKSLVIRSNSSYSQEVRVFLLYKLEGG